MKKICLYFSLFVSLFICSNALAEKTVLTIGAGDVGGTYFTVVSEIAKYCSSPTLGIQYYTKDGKTPEGGSVNNLRNLLNNKINCGIIQTDIAQLEKMKNNGNMSRIVALVPLHQEQVHFIVPTYINAEQATSRLGKFIGKKNTVTVENPMSSISHLSYKNVTAWGGSIKTAEIIKLMTNIPFNIIPANDQNDAMAKISSGQVSCIIAVVGAPAKWIEDLPKSRFKLLSIKEEADRLKDIYATSNISYDNLGATGQSIVALGVDSVLFTREYKVPKTKRALAELQSNIKREIGTIQDTSGTHPVWQKVDPNRHPKWDKVFNEK